MLSVFLCLEHYQKNSRCRVFVLTLNVQAAHIRSNSVFNDVTRSFYSLTNSSTCLPGRPDEVLGHITERMCL